MAHRPDRQTVHNAFDIHWRRNPSSILLRMCSHASKPERNSLSVLCSLVRTARRPRAQDTSESGGEMGSHLNTQTFIPKTHAASPPSLIAANDRPVTASKSRACREGHTSGPCLWLFSAARTQQ